MSISIGLLRAPGFVYKKDILMAHVYRAALLAGRRQNEHHMMMVFDILIRIKSNIMEYIECPIVPVVEQTLHGHT